MTNLWWISQIFFRNRRINTEPIWFVLFNILLWFWYLKRLRSHWLLKLHFESILYFWFDFHFAPFIKGHLSIYLLNNVITNLVTSENRNKVFESNVDIVIIIWNINMRWYRVQNLLCKLVVVWQPYSNKSYTNLNRGQRSFTICIPDIE